MTNVSLCYRPRAPLGDTSTPGDTGVEERGRERRPPSPSININIYAPAPRSPSAHAHAAGGEGSEPPPAPNCTKMSRIGKIPPGSKPTLVWSKGSFGQVDRSHEFKSLFKRGSVVRRIASTTGPYNDIWYLRLTDTTGVDPSHLFSSAWTSRNNLLNVDFKLYRYYRLWWSGMGKL